MNYFYTLRVFTVAVLSCNAAIYGQITQQRPELCGTPEFMAVPSNLMATFETLIVTPPGSTTGVKTNFFGNVKQVCPIPSSRYLVFVMSSVGSYEVIILNGKTGILVDKFEAYSPVVSPDQHWLVYRAFYSHTTQLPASEEYLLDDLTKDAAENTMPNPDWFTEGVRGKVIYPVVGDGKPFHHIGLPEEQTHSIRSDSFYWSKDSTAIIFADKVQDTLCIVLVTLDASGPKTRIHRLAGDVVKNLDSFRQMDVDSQSQSVQMRFNDFNTGEKKALTLRWSDFEAAKPEVHDKITPAVDAIMVPSRPKKN